MEQKPTRPAKVVPAHTPCHPLSPPRQERRLPPGSPRAGKAPRDGPVGCDLTPETARKSELKLMENLIKVWGITEPHLCLKLYGACRRDPGKQNSHQRQTLPRESALPDLCLNHPAERDRTFAPSLVTSLKSKGWFNIARNIYCLSQLQTNYKLTKYLKRLFQYLVTLEADTQSLIGMFFSALPSELN